MFLRCTERKKDGKVHYYYSVVENRRVAHHKVTQRTVLYLGEINQLQETAWQDLLDRFDSECQGHTVKPFRQPRLLGPAPLRPEEVDAIGVQLSRMELRRPRAFGNCWLGCEIWRLLELDDFWRQKLPEGREAVAWHKVIELLAVNRLVDPGSEWRLHRQWFDQSAMDQLLETDFAVASKDRLYRCLDRLLAHKQELFGHLKQRWQTLFGAQFELLLYDLTSTYVEGAAELIDVCIPTTQGSWLVLPRYTEPSLDQHLLLKKLNLQLPQQPPPRIETAEAKQSWEGLKQLRM